MSAALSLLLVFGFQPAAQAQTESGLSLLRLGVDAAAGGMGEAQVAYSRDAFSAYWNPAGLAAPTANDAALSHQRWIYDIRTYALGSRLRLSERGGIGLFVMALNGSAFTGPERPATPEGELGPYSVGAGLGYGHAFGPLRLGLTAKYVRDRLFVTPITSYAIDLGVQTQVLDDFLRVGVALQNIGTTSGLIDEALPLPRTFRAGVAAAPFQIVAEEDGAPLLRAGLSLDVAHVFPDDAEPVTRVHAGLTAEIMALLRMRVGYLSNSPLRRFTAGAGLHYEPFTFDYAFLPFRGQLEQYGHMVTLSYTW